jgi:Protein of unknown function DUF262/Protein of unknown function (DUF1524)
VDITPDKQNINGVFSNTAYYIDFYQRDYRLTDEPVLRLLDDVLFKFREQYARSSDLDPGEETITTHYPWYYLNTYVTNVVDGKVYVVDGQQRLTTLALMLIKLRHLAKLHESKLAGWINNKIAGQSGFEQEFWMNHIVHNTTQQALYDGVDPKAIDTGSGITAQNMVRNYEIISTFLDKELYNKHRFETFVFYFLHRLVLINLTVEQTDVSMVFEVINDRGVRLRPYEILKGKLLGQIDKTELDKEDYNGLWENRSARINAIKLDELDNFFRFYLKAKFAATRRDGQRFDGDYHRAMFAPDMDERLGLLHSPTRVKEFLNGDFTYYTDLYVKLRQAYARDQKTFRAVYYNQLLGLDAPFLLLLSACLPNDADEDEKIEAIGYEIDRYFSLLQLQSAYDSNDFADSLFRISEAIRGKPVDFIRPAFDAQLTAMIAARRNVDEAAPLSYAAFKPSGINLNTRFKRYFFARIDEFLAKNMNLNSKHPIGDLVNKTGPKTGFHIEHILSWNQDNKDLFDGDEERFEQERNRLGGILLLKGKDNISSNNEPYREKLKSYANTLYWNESLRADSYKSKLDMTELKARYDLDLKPMERFGPDEVEARHKLLFELVGIIWR